MCSYILHSSGSKRSAHSNAYTYGFWKNQRIVLFDTIIGGEEREKVEKLYKDKTSEAKDANRGMSNDEVLAVTGHELGHWRLRHFHMYLVMIAISLLLMILVFAYFCKSEALFKAFGFSTTPVIIGIILVYTFILAPYSELVKVVFNVVSRRCEFAADSFSADLGYTDQLISSLKNLTKENLMPPIDDELYSMCNNNHPTVLERIEALKKRK
ncbi:peptidase, M48 family [Oesophagostomum dentatum]|uniref:Peptidase, M48 family n=1 Tax=Oesophagostomum dentatum TaxID=61180 RepID=A0A0B1TGU9_OESDE|nr:peptidase, M48 family [Oesophagostomum dentatum]